MPSILGQDPDGKATPSDAELAIGRNIIVAACAQNITLAAAVAQALADQRAKYEEVADELDRYIDIDGTFAADLIRQASGGDGAR